MGSKLLGGRSGTTDKIIIHSSPWGDTLNAFIKLNVKGLGIYFLGEEEKGRGRT